MYLANTDLGECVPPGYNKLRTTLLQQGRVNVERLLEPFKTTWPTKGITITFIPKGTIVIQREWSRVEWLVCTVE